MLLRRSAYLIPSFSKAAAPYSLCYPASGAAFVCSRLHATPIVASMAEHEADKSSMVEEEHAKGSNDQAAAPESQEKQLGRLSAPIIPSILNLYNLRATAVDFEIYAPNATFEDPLMKAKGVKQIKSAFYSMPKVFAEGNLVEYSVSETETELGSGEILIDNTQHYKVWGKAIDMKSLIKLQVENGKVIGHQDLWDKHPLWDRNTVRVPLAGRAVEGLRRVNMMVTHALMGCGKDPKTTQ